MKTLMIASPAFFARYAVDYREKAEEISIGYDQHKRALLTILERHAAYARRVMLDNTKMV
jgi:hypothetical protein